MGTPTPRPTQASCGQNRFRDLVITAACGRVGYAPPDSPLSQGSTAACGRVGYAPPDSPLSQGSTAACGRVGYAPPDSPLSQGSGLFLQRGLTILKTAVNG
ncbi:MAG: hypothetical protein WCA35_26595 [Kovacikia sp.]